MSRAIFTYGRFNPPTMGHDVLINKLKSIAGGDAVFVFASQSNDPSRNPFDYKTKTKYMKKAFQIHQMNAVAQKDVGIYKPAII